MRRIHRLLLAATTLYGAAASAQISGDVVKVGVLTDMTGVYADYGGKGSLVAAQMAIDEIGGKINGKPVVLVHADHQNKVDLASQIAKQWLLQDGVDVLAEVLSTPVALAVQEINRPKGAVLFFNGVVSTALTGKNCAPTGVNWMYDAYAYATGTGGAVTKEGGKTWFMVTVDNPFGANMEKMLTDVVTANGGKIVGGVKHPLNTDDFIEYLVTAEDSKSQVISLQSAGRDTINAVKQSFDLRSISKGQTILTAYGLGISDIHKIGLSLSQGLRLTSAFYWDYDEQTREWSKRFFDRFGKMPTEIQAGVYSSLVHYFKAVKAAGSDDGSKVMQKMREIPIKDAVVRNARLRPDGRMVHDMYLAEVKKPAESKGAWDYYKIRRAIPGDEAFQPLEQSECPLLKKK